MINGEQFVEDDARIREYFERTIIRFDLTFWIANFLAVNLGNFHQLGKFQVLIFDAFDEDIHVVDERFPIFHFVANFDDEFERLRLRSIGFEDAF